VVAFDGWLAYRDLPFLAIASVFDLGLAEMDFEIAGLGVSFIVQHSGTYRGLLYGSVTSWRMNVRGLIQAWAPADRSLLCFLDTVRAYLRLMCGHIDWEKEG
jgi:hypothetical protein